MATTLTACCAMCGLRTAAAQVPRRYVTTKPQGIIACGNEPRYGGEFKPTPSLIRTQSGDERIDAGFQGERNMLDYCFGLSGSDGSRDFGRPEFSFYDDTSARIGAKALRGGPAGCHIYFGLLLINDEMVERPSKWETVVSGFLAHEWAHAFQYKSALDERLFLWETHADFLAGWYLGLKRVQGGSIDSSLFQQALYRNGSKYFSENDYGLPQQRSDSAEAGMRFALSNTRPNRRPDVSLAAEAGYDYVLAMRARAQHP